jgi:hypothetical protein
MKKSEVSFERQAEMPAHQQLAISLTVLPPEV